jgi:Glycosyltransferase family 87
MVVTPPSPSPRFRLAWFGAVAFVAIFGLLSFAIWVSEAWGPGGWWGIDLRLVLDAGQRLTSGQDLYVDPKFLYPPLAAVVAVPFDSLSFDLVSLAYATLKVAIAVAAVATLTTGWRTSSRVLAMIGLIGCLPFLHDLMLGNANVILVGAALPAVLGQSRHRNGILLGIVTAIFAKPLVIPILLWLLVWRRPVFIGTVASGLISTGVGILFAGAANYSEWVTALFAGTRYATPFAGNHGVSALVPDLWVPIALIVAVALVIVLLWRGPQTGLAWAVTAGLLIAPYAGTYGALPIALALPAMSILAPPMALIVVAVSPIATTIPLPFYAAGILVGALTYRESARGLARSAARLVRAEA